MKIWTYAEAKMKMLTEYDLLDETFINSNEMIGYFNDGLQEAESEIHTMNAENEYFRTKTFIPLVTGIGNYTLPDNIYANKIIGIMYSNGSVIYPICQYRRRGRYQNMLYTDQYGSADDYRYTLYNDVPGQAMMEIHPVARETAILPPTAGSFTPVIMWYMRNCARIPLMAIGSQSAEYCNPEIVNVTSVNTTADTITTKSGTNVYGVKSQGIVGCYPGSIAYVAGDSVKFTPAPGATLPAPLVQGTIYYILSNISGVIQISATKGGSAIDLTTTGTTFFTITVAATQAIVDATLLDIPEFTPFVIQWAKVCSFMKELKSVPAEEVAKLTDLKKQMIDSLTLAIPDDDDEIQPDYSHYQEMS